MGNSSSSPPIQPNLQAYKSKDEITVTVTRDASGSAGFRFDTASLTVKSVTPHGTKCGIVPGRRILRVDGVNIKDAKQYLACAKTKQTFKLTLGPKVRQSMFSPKPTTTTTTPTIKYRWQWHDNTGWKDFAPALDAQIEQAYQNGRSTITIFPIPGRAYIVNTSAMTQKNSRTNFSRQIRRFQANMTTTATTTPSLFPGLTSIFGTNTTTTTTTSSGTSHPGTPLPITMVNFVSKPPDQLDLSQVTGWNRVYPPDYDPDDTDPISFESMGDGKSREVVELRCSTPKLQCIMFKDSIRQCIMNGMIKCPVCKTRFKIPGPQPSGTMRLSLNPTQHCSGYHGKGSIYISYNFPGGTQGTQHYHPGQTYAGTSRNAYLPDTAEGRKAMRLLIKAFQAGILFRVGQSVTTGSHNQTVWGGVHQKSTTSGGTAAHGWPDPTYFNRLTSECAANGVFSDEFEAARAKEMKEHRIARQKSAEAKKKKEEEQTKEQSKVEDPKKEEEEEEEITNPEIESLRAKITELSKGIQAAMKSGDRKKIMDFMRQRNQTQAKITSLQEKLKEENKKEKEASTNDEKGGGGEPDDTLTKKRALELSARLAEIQKEISKAMRSQNRGQIVKLMQERSKVSAELSKLTRSDDDADDV